MDFTKERKPELNRNEIAEGFIMGFSALLPMISNNDFPDIPEKVTRLLGAYFAGNKNVIDVADSLVLIDRKDMGGE